MLNSTTVNELLNSLGKDFTMREARSEDEAIIARLIVDGMWYYYCPIFQGHHEVAVDVMQKMIKLEHSISGVHSIVAEVNEKVVGTIAVLLSPPDKGSLKVGKLLAREVRTSMSEHLGHIYAFRAAVLLSYPKYKLTESEAYLARCVVAPGYRHMEIAPALFKAAESLGEASHKNTIACFTVGSNRALVRLYRSWGYSEVGRQKSILTNSMMNISEFAYLKKYLIRSDELDRIG